MLESWGRGYKTFSYSQLSFVREIFTTNKYENDNNSWLFHIY